MERQLGPVTTVCDGNVWENELSLICVMLRKFVKNGDLVVMSNVASYSKAKSLM